MRNVLFGLTLFVLSPLAMAAPLQFGQGPIQPAAKQAAVAGAPQGTLVQVDVAGLAAFEEGSLVWLPGSAGKAVPARVTKVLAREDGSLDWSARVPTESGGQTATIVVRQGHAFGLIPQPKGAALRLETRHGQSRIVEEKAALRPEGPDVLLPPDPTPDQRALRKRQEAGKAEGTPRIDVLVAYQPSLVEVWGSVAAVQARIAYLETITNQAYADTGMDLEIRVVATHLVDFEATADNSDALYAITDASALPVKQELDRLRAMYGADLVKLMRNFDRVNQTSCGIAWLGGYHGNPFIPEYGFSVTADLGFGGDGCGEWTFAHELGHNQGAHHDIETTNGDYGAFEYSRGHRQTVSADSGFATVMAYNTGPQQRLGRFSDPDLLECLGQPCGIAEEADNARGIVETAAMVAGMVPEVSAGALPLLSLDDVQITEGNSGQRPVRFTLSLSAPAAGPVTVYLATRAGSATNTDFAPRTYNILIPAGQTAVTIDVGVRGDTLMEPDEVFSLDIQSVTGAGIAKGQGVATIVSDDAIPTLVIDDIEIQEGDDGVRDAVFTARLSHASNQNVRFDVEAGQLGGANAADIGFDFVPMRRQGIEIPAGAQGVQFTVAVVGDVETEQDESFYVAVGGVSGARIDESIIRARILDDDEEGAPGLPRLSVQPASITEGSAGWQTANVTVSLNAPAPAEVRFALLAQGITATAGRDFDVSGLGALVLPAGATSMQVPLQVFGDTLDEANETLELRVGNVVGAVPSVTAALVTLLDDDGSAQTPPMQARDDRFILLENAGSTRLSVLDNDAVDAARLTGGSLQVIEQPVFGQLQVDNNGTSGTVADDTLVYVPAADRSYEDVVSYRLCEGDGRCDEGLVQIVLRPAADAFAGGPSGRGFVDIEVPDLRPVSELQLDTNVFSTAAPMTVSLDGDPSPESPWDDPGTSTSFHEIQNWYFGTPNEDYGPEWWHVVVDASAPEGGDVDVYVGIDDDGNRRADPGELRCGSAMGGSLERCEMEVEVAEDSKRFIWVRRHNRSVVPTTAQTHLFVLKRDDYPFHEDEWAATAPGMPAAGEPFPTRVSWNLPELSPGHAALGLVGLRNGQGQLLGEFPVRIDRPDIAAAAGFLPLDANQTRTVLVGGGDVLDRFYVDAPAGRGFLTAYMNSSAPVQVRLLSAPAGTDHRVAPAPADAVVLSEGALEYSESATVVLDTPGRLYFEVSNPNPEPVTFTARIDATGTAPGLAPGSYFNPDRSGHGLFLYPAGNQFVGLWYTYLQDGSPTWYYLQGEAPAQSGSMWANLYRASWNGSANRLTRVGEVAVTQREGGLVFSYMLDGEVGSELMTPLGAGCPTLAGQPLDASSHWFDPAKAGTGYSVQLFPNYEFYAAFVYDSRGVARFLTSEAGSFRGADATLPLEQLTGFCPLCERTGAPTRADVGTLRRRFDATGLVQMQLDAIYTGGVPGAWTSSDLVQALGGPGTTQGCPAP